jgi:hypothetical protein
MDELAEEIMELFEAEGLGEEDISFEDEADTLALFMERHVTLVVR